MCLKGGAPSRELWLSRREGDAEKPWSEGVASCTSLSTISAWLISPCIPCTPILPNCNMHLCPLPSSGCSSDSPRKTHLQYLCSSEHQTTGCCKVVFRTIRQADIGCNAIPNAHIFAGFSPRHSLQLLSYVRLHKVITADATPSFRPDTLTEKMHAFRRHSWGTLPQTQGYLDHTLYYRCKKFCTSRGRS